MGTITKQKKITKKNHITGEITEEEIEHTLKFPKTADFVMTFTKDLGYMKNLSKGEILVMFGLLKLVTLDNEIILNIAVKERICKEFEIKISSINPIISNLKKKEMIYQKDRGVYALNTYLFGKGSWANIKKQRMLIEWDFQKLTKKVMIEQDFMNEDELLEKEIKEQEERLKELRAKKLNNN
jgi:predicted transcriptional regulator